MLVDHHGRFALMEQGDLDALPEYSASIPTGKTIGKRWKRNVSNPGEAPRWWLGEYADEPDQVTWPGQIQIIWHEIEVVE